MCECMSVCVCVHCVSANVCVSALYVCLYASVVHIKNFSQLSLLVLKLPTFELCECIALVQMCECIICVPVYLSSPHEKFHPSKLTGFEVTDI